MSLKVSHVTIRYIGDEQKDHSLGCNNDNIEEKVAKVTHESCFKDEKVEHKDEPNLEEQRWRKDIGTKHCHILR
jgi:hypothetical protein